MTEFETLPVRSTTKRKVQNLKYEMRVDSFDAVVKRLVEAYDGQSTELTN